MEKCIMYYITKTNSGMARISLEPPEDDLFFIEVENLPFGDDALRFDSDNNLIRGILEQPMFRGPDQEFLSGLTEDFMDSPIEKLKEQGRQTYRNIRHGTNISALTFVVLAQSEMVDDITIAENSDLFPLWDENYTTQNRLTIVRDEGYLYRNIHPIFDKTQNIKPGSDIDGIMWQLIGNPGEEFPMWVQPLGTHDAYPPGAKVSHKNKRWENTHVGLNTWEPGVYGWTEVV